MLNRIFNNFVALILISVVALAILFGILFMRAAQGQEMAAVQDKAHLIAALLDLGALSDYGGLATGNTRMTIIAPDGGLYFDSHPHANALANRAYRPEFIQAIRYGSGQSTRNSTTLGVNTYYYAVRLDNGYVLRLSRTFRSLGDVFPRILPDLIMITLGIAGVAYIVARRLTRKIIKPLAEIDLETSANKQVYEELEPFIQKIAHQRQALDGQFASLKHAEGQRREFTANVSHELKTPLTTISALAEMIASGMAKAEDVANFAEKISSRAKRLVALIEDIIRLSEFDESKIERNFTTFDIQETAQQVMAALEEKAAEKQVVIHLLGQPMAIHGNQRLIHELLFNLVENAIKYNKDGGSVTMQLEDPGDAKGRRKISVKDTGMGIPLAQQGRIFERFYRVDTSRSQAIGGTGLGLSIVKHIAEHHGGTVEMESQEGEGTTFTFLL